MKELSHIDLFSGIGGFSLAASWAGFRTVCFVENEPYCQEVLKLRFGGYVEDPKFCGCIHGEDGERWSTVRGQREPSTRDGDRVYNGTPIIPDIRNFDGTKFRGSTLLTGGFPCQPFSVAGKRGGKEDDRYLWPEMLRVIQEARPTWIVGENVAGIINVALEQVCADLEAENYEVQPLIIPASAVNAPHQRKRVWILAYNPDAQDSINRGDGGRDNGNTPRVRRPLQAKGSNSDAPDSEGLLSQGRKRGQKQVQLGREGWAIPWLEVASRLCLLDDGLSPGLVGYLGITEAYLKVRDKDRVKKLKALGNAIVPQVAYEILKGIAEIENSMGIKKERKKT